DERRRSMAPRCLTCDARSVRPPRNLLDAIPVFVAKPLPGRVFRFSRGTAPGDGHCDLVDRFLGGRAGHHHAPAGAVRDHKHAAHADQRRNRSWKASPVMVLEKSVTSTPFISSNDESCHSGGASAPISDTLSAG